MSFGEQSAGSAAGSPSASFDIWDDNERKQSTGDDGDSDSDRSPLVAAGNAQRCERCGRCGAAAGCEDNPCGYASSVALKCVGVAAFAAVMMLVFGRGTMGSGQSDTTARRSFVCITGQLDRLELENKIVTVLEPLRRAGLEPDIALVLDDTTSYVTNDQRVQVDFIPPFASYDEVAGHLRELDFNVITDGPYKQVPEPLVNEDYVRLLHKHSSMSEEKHLERAKNNIRMLESWAQCYPEMTKDLKRVGSYDVAVRIREDTGFLEALDMASVLDEVSAEPKTVISNGCRFGGGGMNDKFAILSMDATQTYFVEPFRYLYTKPIPEQGVKSSETFIKYAYLEEGLNVVHSDTIRHIIKLMSDEDGRTMLYPQEKQKLRKMCGIDVADDDAGEPNACTAAWDAQRHRLEPFSQICWPYSFES